MDNNLLSIAKQYIAHGQHLFPLKPDSKEPACKWTVTRPLTTEQLPPLTGNLAVRLQPNQLVIDVDVKHDAPGKDSYDKLCKMIPAIAMLGYTTVTASGGVHIYLTLPNTADPKQLKKSLPEYPGIDFLHHGNYAVLAGSITNGTQYTSNPNLRFPFPLAPASLLDIITRITGPIDTPEDIDDGWGCLSADDLTDVLFPLNPTEYHRDSPGDWLSLAMACHYSTAGQGFTQFNEWCMGDTYYHDSSETNATRWKSFKSQHRNITAYWLRNELRSKDCPSTLLEAKLDDLRRQKLFQPVTDSTIDYKERIAGMKLDSEATNILNQIAKDKSLSPIDIKSIQEALRQKFPKVLTHAVTGTILKGNPLNTTGEQWAEKLIEHINVHCIAFSEGTLWVFKPKHGMFRAIDQKTLVHNITNFVKTNGLNDIPKTLIEEIRYFVEAKTADPDFFSVETDNMFNIVNGELHMTADGFRLLPHNPHSRKRNVLPVRYDPNNPGEPRVWSNYLDTAIHTEDRDISYRKLAVGLAYTLTESVPWLKRAWYILGPSQTGKSKIIDLIGAMTGNNYSANAWSYIQKNTFALSGLVGKLANLQGETDSTERVNPAYFKQLVAGDPMKAEIKGQPAFIFHNQAVFWNAANEIPAFAKDNIQGVLERICVIKLTNPRCAVDRRETLLAEMIEEMDDIFHWAIKIYQEEFYKDRCHTILENLTKLEMEEVAILSEITDPGLLWFNHRIEFTGDAEHTLVTTEAWEDFMTFTAENDIMHAIYSVKSFGHALRRWLEAIPGAGHIKSQSLRQPDGSVVRVRRGLKLASKSSNMLN